MNAGAVFFWILMVPVYFFVGFLVSCLLLWVVDGEELEPPNVFVATVPFWPIVLVGLVIFALCRAVRLLWRLAMLATILLLASVAHASPPVVCHSRVVQQAVVVPTIAQTVQVLHAAVPSAFYGYSAAAQQYQNAGTMSLQDGEVLQELRAIRELLANGAGGAVRTAAVDPLRLTRLACAKCHSGAGAKNGFRVDGDLSNEDRLKAMERMLTDDKSAHMPKGKDLDPVTLGKVLQELGRRQEVSSPSNDPPPPPRPQDPSDEPRTVE